MEDADSTDSDGAILSEQFPGEAHPHYVLDIRPDPVPFGPVKVPAGNLFLMGDNRDNAADSRFGPEMGGVGMVPVTAVMGKVDSIFWSPARSRWLLPIQDAR